MYKTSHQRRSTQPPHLQRPPFLLQLCERQSCSAHSVPASIAFAVKHDIIHRYILLKNLHIANSLEAFVDLNPTTSRLPYICPVQIAVSNLNPFIPLGMPGGAGSCISSIWTAIPHVPSLMSSFQTAPIPESEIRTVPLCLEQTSASIDKCNSR